MWGYENLEAWRGRKLKAEGNEHKRVLYRDDLQISCERWLELLQDSSVFKDEDILLINTLYRCNNFREKASVLAETLGVSSHSVLNLQIGRLGKRIIKRFPHVQYPTRADGKIRYWHIPFWAEDAEKKGQFYWQLRPEVRLAVECLINNDRQPIIVTPEKVLLAQELSEKEIESLFEGAKKQIIVNAYERNIKAKRECIKEYGYKCGVCGFDFEKTYGEIGIGYIEIHHLKPLCEINREYQVDPVNHLRPVCPNCHAMLHRANLSIEELKDRIKQ